MALPIDMWGARIADSGTGTDDAAVRQTLLAYPRKSSDSE
jgi:hypothetical protein